MSSPSILSDTLFTPDAAMDCTESAVVALDVGCAFTKVSYWNAENNASSILRIDGNDSIPTAIAYTVAPFRATDR